MDILKSAGMGAFIGGASSLLGGAAGKVAFSAGARAITGTLRSSLSSGIDDVARSAAGAVGKISPKLEQRILAPMAWKNSGSAFSMMDETVAGQIARDTGEFFVPGHAAQAFSAGMKHSEFFSSATNKVLFGVGWGGARGVTKVVSQNALSQYLT